MPFELIVTIQFQLHSALHTTGDRAELWTDKALVLDWHRGETPILPATSIKGWLRENAERALRGLDLKVCDSSQPSGMCGECIVCQVFGSPRRKAPLRFSDAFLDTAETTTRISASLSRHRKTAHEERLFATEVAWAQRLRVQVFGVFPTHANARDAAALLSLAANQGTALGAARSRGLGWLELESFEGKVNGRPLSESEMRARIRDWRGEGHE